MRNISYLNIQIVPYLFQVFLLVSFQIADSFYQNQNQNQNLFDLNGQQGWFFLDFEEPKIFNVKLGFQSI